jgi:acetoin utilization deacetylase AcuC-like enzyme
MVKQKPNFYADLSFGNFFYHTGHPMKPFRINILNELVISYGLHSCLNFKKSKKISNYHLLNFHNLVYIKNNLKHDNDGDQDKLDEIENFLPKNHNLDCPVFKGILEYCQIYSSASISSAFDILKNETGCTINWSGGYHHAKKKRASGFCYINDIVLCILELLKKFQKVLYIDIDVHHGDGVEEAFYLSKRVFCISFHNFKKFFFPETGNLLDTGLGLGKKYSINVPLKNGIKDKPFYEIFYLIAEKVIEKFQPDSIVLQAGADSLAGDKLGNFNITYTCHAECINFIKDLGIPFVVLGGGGYKKKNVAKCWTNETSLLCDKKLNNKLPYNRYYYIFSPTFKLDFQISGMFDKNSKNYLQSLKKIILNNILKII